MRSSGSAKTLGGFSVVQLYAKSAKESALRVAEENGIPAKGGKLWESMKAKAHSLSSQVQGTAKRATSTRRGAGAKSSSSSQQRRPGGTAVDEELVNEICNFFDGRASQVAARLALSKTRGKLLANAAKKIDAKEQKMQIACDWLLDEKNVPEIEAAENAEIERSTAAQELPAAAKEVTPLLPSAYPRSTDAAPVRCSSLQPRRTSDASDDGRGLGFFMSRKSCSPRRPSEPSPRKVPMPGRLSRGSFGSARVSTGSVDSGVGDSRPSLARRVSIGSQTSAGSEGHHPAMTPRDNHADVGESGLSRCTGDEGCEAEDYASGAQDAACGADQYTELEEEDDGDEEEEEEDEEAVFGPPPDSTCWDWPLSRHEKKARVQMLERQMSVMDRKNLKQELDGLRREAVHLRKMSTGGTSQASRPSRLST